MRRWSATALASLVVSLGVAQQPAATASTPPNIVIILADDLGFSDIGCYGSEIDTPNLDRLARDGLRFTQFYNAGRCCPSRASLLTGLYAHQCGIGDMTGDRGVPAYQGYLNERCVTLAEVLRQAGYVSMVAGKWHVGAKPEAWPLQRGFHRFFGLFDGGVYFKQNFAVQGNPTLVSDNGGAVVPDDFYVTDAITDAAIDFVDSVQSRRAPFFLLMSHIAPHVPLQAKKADIDKYRDRYAHGWDELRRQRRARALAARVVDDDCVLSERDPRVPAWQDQPEAVRADLALRMAIYAAQVDSLDQSVGRLCARLRELGVFDNTLLLFLSDNGGNAAGGTRGFDRVPDVPLDQPGSYSSYGLGWANASNAPFRRHKGFVHEGGIATPLIVHWPAAMARRGELEHQPAHIIDLMATCVAVSGATYPDKRNGVAVAPMVGTSLLPAFRGEQLARRAPLCWEHEGNRAVRVDDWKLVAVSGGAWELYDLASDRSEMHDLAAEQPERVAELARRYEQWAAAVGVEAWPLRQRPRQPGDGK